MTVSLIFFIKYYVVLIVSLIFLFTIEYVICCLCELYFDAEKLVIYDCANWIFYFGMILMTKKVCIC